MRPDHTESRTLGVGTRILSTSLHLRASAAPVTPDAWGRRLWLGPLRGAASQIGELSFGIPAGWRCHALAAPGHASLLPLFAPALVSETVIIVRHSELKAARGTDLVGPAAAG